MARPKKLVRTLRRQKKRKIVTSELNYNFLAYIRVVFSWAVKNHDLTRPQIEVLLYLHSKAIFTFTEFCDYYRLIGIRQGISLKQFIETGWIKVWREKKPKQKALYSLTHKGKVLCGRMHSFLMGDIAMPTSERRNKMVKSNVRIDGYYMNVIHQMNREREERKKKEGEEISED